MHSVQSIWSEASCQRLTWMMCHWVSLIKFSLKQCKFMLSNSHCQEHYAISLCKWYHYNLIRSLKCSLIQKVSQKLIQDQELKRDTENS